MIFPCVLLVLIYQYVPMFGIIIAFQKFVPARGFFGSQWIGWDNFTYVFNMPDIWHIIYNTIYIAVLKIVAMMLVPISISLLLNEVRHTFVKRSVQTLIYLPHFMSWIILGGILIDILSPSQGIVNQMLGWFGVEPIFFLGDNRWFRFTLVFSETWKEFGFSTIIFLAALTSINPTLYEAATIDGANRWKQTWHVTLPGILPVIILLGTLSLGSVLNAGFDQIFNLYNPSVYETGDILDTLIYRLGLVNAQYGVATAVGLFKSVVGVCLISLSYFLAYRLANYRIF